jgi:hypothetical protein
MQVMDGCVNVLLSTSNLQTSRARQQNGREASQEGRTNSHLRPMNPLETLLGVDIQEKVYCHLSGLM